MSNTRLKQGLLLAVIILSLNSCATVFNGRFSNVNVETSRPINMVIEGDTVLRENNEPVYLRVENSKLPLHITTFDSTGTKNINVLWKTNPVYWANVFTGPVFFAGFLVDEVTGKKRSYPRNIYIDVDGVGNSYLPYAPMDSLLLEKRNKFTFAPVSLLHTAHPAFEFGYERLHKGNLATQVSFGVFRSWDNEFARNSSGIKASIEEKFFFRNQKKTRIYGALAFEYHNKEHDANIDFLGVDNRGRVDFGSRFTRLTRVEKQFFALTPRIGFQSYVTPQLVLEGFFGLGLRHRRVRHLNAIPNTVEDTDDFFFNFTIDSNRSGNRLSTNWDLNLRLAWVF